MTMMVQTSTDDAPALLALIELRRAHGLDRHDEWWEGVYRIVTNPSPEHQRLVLSICMLFHGLITDPDVEVFPGINIGIDKVDTRAPDVAIVRRDTDRTSPAFLASSELVVEILSPSERAAAKLEFYAQWNVREYVEIDQQRGTVVMLANVDGEWTEIERSSLIDVALDDFRAFIV